MVIYKKILDITNTTYISKIIEKKPIHKHIAMKPQNIKNRAKTEYIQ